MIWEVKEWTELSTSEVENIFSLRSEVFVVEQDCIYQDIDGKDQKAKHVLGKKENDIVAYARIFKPGDYFKEASFGRAVVKKTERGKGVGDELVKNCLENITEEEIKISAQSYLKGFYGKHGFKSEGNEYLEDGIPHTAMFIRQ
ncbi:MAG: GNAT family N-acetyltransferase [Flavobacteriaceae bacterium]